MWLLEASIRQAIEQALKSGFTPSAEQQASYMARYNDEDAERGSRVLAVAGDQAEVSIKGVLTKAPSFMAMLFGGGNTTYPEVIAAIQQAENDASVTSITLAVDSPGGHFDGLFDLLAVIQSAKKPVNAVVGGLAASAAYAIVCQADSIEARSIASRFGSIGVAVSFTVMEEDVDLTSTAAPKKRPDVRTPEGKAMVVEELDALHEIFADSIAGGRGVTTERVNAEFGQGATLLAGEALKRGMIDAIAKAPPVSARKTNTTTASGGNIPETGPMDLKTLKAQHPDVYAAAVQEGTESERDRVTAHLTMGEASGALETASKAIKDGTAMTHTLQATYLTAGMNRKDVATRQGDDAAAAAADTAAAAAQGGDDDADNVASLVEARLGVSAEA